jgi:hypothetical protein
LEILLFPNKRAKIKEKEKEREMVSHMVYA